MWVNSAIFSCSPVLQLTLTDKFLDVNDYNVENQLDKMLNYHIDTIWIVLCVWYSCGLSLGKGLNNTISRA